MHVGIDPGKFGALCIIYSRSNFTVCDTPTHVVKTRSKGRLRAKTAYTEYAMRDLVASLPEHSTITIEKAHAFPVIKGGFGGKEGSVSTFSSGYGYGLWRGLLISKFPNVTEVVAQTWRKELGVARSGDTKAAALDMALQISSIMGQQEKARRLFFTPRGRLLDGRVDAFLIAEYGRRLCAGQKKQ